MGAPLIVINCKTYASASGIAAEALAVQMQSIDTSARLVMAASALDIGPVASAAPDLEVWAQHLDPVDHGSNTGRILPSTRSKGAQLVHWPITQRGRSLLDRSMNYSPSYLLASSYAHVPQTPKKQRH